eukprot:s2357_g9.t1
MDADVDALVAASPSERNKVQCGQALALGSAVAEDAMDVGNHLPRVHTLQPDLPGPENEDAPRVAPASGGTKGEVSKDFRALCNSLVNQLVQQHMREMAAVKGGSPLIGPRSPQNGPRKDPRKRTKDQEDFWMPSSLSQGMNDGTESDSSSAAAARTKVHARDILQKLESEADEEQDKKTSPHFVNSLYAEANMDFDGHSKSGYFATETESEFLARYKRMTRLEKWQLWLQSNRYESIMAVILCFNVLWMALDLQFFGSIAGYHLHVFTMPVPPEQVPTWESVLTIGDLLFTGVFVLDVIVRICVLRSKFWKQFMNYVDVAVSVTNLAEFGVLYATTLPVNPILFRLLRLGKLARAIRMINMTSVLGSLQLLVKCLASSSNMLFWSFCLLTFVQCVAGLIVSTLCRDFFEDEDYDESLREAVFRYYGTFTRTFLTMFEILFANWGPACRVLVENFSEWFSIFFLFYRCVLGFAVLNVVNAVFVQQTMKTAGSDEELAFKQKEKDAQMYTRKVKRLFQTIDDSGDGTLNLEEFSKLVQSPKLKFWMSQLELEYHDLLSLFEFLDNGDGEITLMEFIEGAARLRGGAKALDIWRIETKLEVLFEEVLKALHHSSGKIMPLSVQEVFQKSTFRHIKTTKIDAEEREDETDKAENSRVSKVSNVL